MTLEEYDAMIDARRARLLANAPEPWQIESNRYAAATQGSARQFGEDSAECAMCINAQADWADAVNNAPDSAKARAFRYPPASACTFPARGWRP